MFNSQNVDKASKLTQIVSAIVSLRLYPAIIWYW